MLEGQERRRWVVGLEIYWDGYIVDLKVASLRTV